MPDVFGDGESVAAGLLPATLLATNSRMPTEDGQNEVSIKTWNSSSFVEILNEQNDSSSKFWPNFTNFLQSITDSYCFHVLGFKKIKS